MQRYFESGITGLLIDIGASKPDPLLLAAVKPIQKILVAETPNAERRTVNTERRTANAKRLP